MRKFNLFSDILLSSFLTLSQFPTVTDRAKAISSLTHLSSCDTAEQNVSNGAEA